MRKHRSKQRDILKMDREVREGKGVTVEPEKQYKLCGSQGSARKQEAEEFVHGMVHTDKTSTLVSTKSNRVHTPKCEEEDKFTTPFPSADNDANPEHEPSNENVTTPDI